MKLIIGLGNPGTKYAQTRHNAGFRLVDALHAAHTDTFGAWREEFGGLVAEGRMRGEKIALLKPQTFMNLSGDAARAAVDFWKPAPADVLVAYDDFALPLGTVRLRPEGSAGGHHGMQSVIDRLGTAAVPRLRIGIGGPGLDALGGEAFVLGRFSEDEEAALAGAMDDAVRVAEEWI